MPGRAIRPPFWALGVICPVGLGTIPANAGVGAVHHCRWEEQTLSAALSVGGGGMVASAVHTPSWCVAGLREVAERAASSALGKSLTGYEPLDVAVFP